MYSDLKINAGLPERTDLVGAGVKWQTEELHETDVIEEELHNLIVWNDDVIPIERQNTALKVAM